LHSVFFAIEAIPTWLLAKSQADFLGNSQLWSLSLSLSLRLEAEKG
jgi:hypothetical protein